MATPEIRSVAELKGTRFRAYNNVTGGSTQGGIGYGLSLAHHVVVTQHHGEIALERYGMGNGPERVLFVPRKRSLDQPEGERLALDGHCVLVDGHYRWQNLGVGCFEGQMLSSFFLLAFPSGGRAKGKCRGRRCVFLTLLRRGGGRKSERQKYGKYEYFHIFYARSLTFRSSPTGGP